MQRAARLAWVGAKGGGDPTNSAGAARVRRFASARPWDRRRVAGHRSAADRGLAFIRGATSWRAHGHQGGMEPKVFAGVRQGGGHTPVTTGPTAVRPAGRTRRTAGTPREEGEDFKGPWGARRLGRCKARTPRRRGAVRRDTAQDVSVCLRSTAFFPKFLNRSAQNNE
jgi:hypothetical protein